MVGVNGRRSWDLGPGAPGRVRGLLRLAHERRTPPFGVSPLWSSTAPTRPHWLDGGPGRRAGSVDVDANGDAALRTPAGLVIDFINVPEAKAVKNRLHIDLETNDVTKATDQALTLGRRSPGTSIRRRVTRPA